MYGELAGKSGWKTYQKHTQGRIFDEQAASPPTVVVGTFTWVDGDGAKAGGGEEGKRQQQDGQ